MPQPPIADQPARQNQASTGQWRMVAPKANAYAESFIGTLKRECLNHFVCFGRDQLDYILSTWVRYYNTRRPHRGKGKENVVLDVNFRAGPIGQVRCKRELGGLIKDYYRDAA